MVNKILLYYKYVDIPYPKRIMKWQQKICQELNLRGRILIAHEGINGTVGGNKENLERYKTIMAKNPLFTNIDFKESPGSANCFPKLQIKVKPEVVHFGLDTQKINARNSGKRLKPEQAHELIKQKPGNLVILDARNKYEWYIGKFINAITPDIDHFRQLPDYIDKHSDQFKDKQVLMYCTGGIRCERASAYLKSKNIAQEVYQIEGGIHRYIEQYPDGFFRGKNYVFDGRIAVRVNDDVLGYCALCKKACDDYINCINTQCNKHFVCCSACIQQFNNTCGTVCYELVQNKKVKSRSDFAPIEIEKNR